MCSQQRVGSHCSSATKTLSVLQLSYTRLGVYPPSTELLCVAFQCLGCLVLRHQPSGCIYKCWCCLLRIPVLLCLRNTQIHRTLKCAMAQEYCSHGFCLPTTSPPLPSPPLHSSPLPTPHPSPLHSPPLPSPPLPSPTGPSRLSYH